MSFSKFVARRYLKAKRKQAFIGVISMITLLGITLGVAALNLGLSVHNGMRSAFLRSLIGEHGQLTISHLDWAEEGFSKEELRTITDILGGVPSVAAISYQKSEWALVTRESRLIAPAQIKGIVPDSEVKISSYLRQLVSGSTQALNRASSASRPGIILGFDLAAKLGAARGDVIRVVLPKLSSPTFAMQRGALKQKTFDVVGIFRTGSSDLDQMVAYVLIDELMAVMGTTRVESVHVSLKDVRTLDATKDLLRRHPQMPISARVVDLRDLNQGLLHALTLEKWGTTLIIGLIMMIVALNMISALIMLVMEKHRDIGIMKSMGASRRMLLAVFLRQGMTLSLWGTLAGSALGVALAVWADHSRLLKLDSSVYEVLNYLPFEVHAVEVGLVALGSLVIAFIASIYPAYQAASLDPVEALRYE